MAYEECPVGACEERALRARVKRGLYEMHLAVLSGLLLRQLKIDVLSVLVVTDKLEFVGRAKRAEFASLAAWRGGIK